MTTSINEQIAHLKGLVAKVIREELTLVEDVGKGWVDVTQRSIDRWNEEICRLERTQLTSWTSHSTRH